MTSQVVLGCSHCSDTSMQHSWMQLDCSMPLAQHDHASNADCVGRKQAKARHLQACSATNRPFAIEQPVKGNHGGHCANQEHDSSWQVDYGCTNKQKKQGIGQERHACYCPAPYDSNHCIEDHSAVV